MSSCAAGSRSAHLGRRGARHTGPTRAADTTTVVALMRRGEIWLARLNPNQGTEVGKLRPVVIVQADPISQAGLATVVVVPLTTLSPEELAELERALLGILGISLA